LNILFLTHFEGLYGSTRSFISLLQGLSKYDINPTVIVPREGGLTEVLKANNVSYIITPVVWWMTEKPVTIKLRFRFLRDLIHSITTTRKLIRNKNFDVIYTNTNVTPAGKFISVIEGIPHIWHIRAFGDLDFSLKYILSKGISLAIIRSSDAIICHAKIMNKHFFKSGTKRVVQIYNGVATRDEFDQRIVKRNEEPRNSNYVFCMLSTITPNKGQETAIMALAELFKKGVTAILQIAGNGKQEYLNHLHKLVHDLQIENQVKFTGVVEDPFPLYIAADCALICSENEAFSRVGLEAMSTALPLIGKNSGGNPEVIVDGETGFLYNTFDELVEAMLKLIQNPEQGRKMGLAGWQRARKLFNIEDYAANVYRVIQSVMDKR